MKLKVKSSLWSDLHESSIILKSIFARYDWLGENTSHIMVNISHLACHWDLTCRSFTLYMAYNRCLDYNTLIITDAWITIHHNLIPSIMSICREQIYLLFGPFMMAEISTSEYAPCVLDFVCWSYKHHQSLSKRCQSIQNTSSLC